MNKLGETGRIPCGQELKRQVVLPRDARYGSAFPNALQKALDFGNLLWDTGLCRPPTSEDAALVRKVPTIAPDGVTGRRKGCAPCVMGSGGNS